MNLKIREFRVSITSFVNSSDLPDEVKALVLADIARQAETEANKKVQEEFTAREKEKKEAELKQQKEGEEDAESVQSGTVGELSE